MSATTTTATTTLPTPAEYTPAQQRKAQDATTSITLLLPVLLADDPDRREAETRQRESIAYTLTQLNEILPEVIKPNARWDVDYVDAIRECYHRVWRKLGEEADLIPQELHARIVDTEDVIRVLVLDFEDYW